MNHFKPIDFCWRGSEVTKQFYYFYYYLHNASNLKVKDKTLENASGDLQSTIKVTEPFHFLQITTVNVFVSMWLAQH
jgi:hypothetical protein